MKKINYYNYDTNKITEIMCNIYHENISEEEGKKLLSNIESNILAEYIIDCFDRGINWDVVKKISLIKY